MTSIGNYQYDIIRKLYFNRVAGTENEIKAADIIRDEVSKIGGTTLTEEFTMPSYEIENAEFEVTEPYSQSVEINGIGRSGNINGTFDFIYVERAEEIDLRNTKGKVVMINSLNQQVYERLCKHEVAAFVVICGGYYDEEQKTDLEKKYLRDKFLKYGKIPGFTMRIRDCENLVKNNVSKVKVVLSQKEFEAKSHNVISEIRGNAYPDEIIAITAHYDSVFFSKGAWDNASGTANALSLYKYFFSNTPKRTLRFVWCGAEEQGLLGSKAYTEAHKDELDKFVFCINFDMSGPVLGHDAAIYTGDEIIGHYIEALAREAGHSTSVGKGVHSSDSAPFSDKGIPSAGFFRNGQGLQFHNRYDCIEPIWSESLEETMRFATLFSERIINSEVFPFEKKMPDDMVKELNKYFDRP